MRKYFEQYKQRLIKALESFYIEPDDFHIVDIPDNSEEDGYCGVILYYFTKKYGISLSFGVDCENRLSLFTDIYEHKTHHSVLVNIDELPKKVKEGINNHIGIFFSIADKLQHEIILEEYNDEYTE